MRTNSPQPPSRPLSLRRRIATSTPEPPVRPSRRRETEPAPAALPAGKVRGGSDDDYPKVEWFLGYSFWRAMPTALSNRMGYLHGGSTSVAYNFNRYVGLVGDFGGYDNSRLTLFTPISSQTVNAGGSALPALSSVPASRTAGTKGSRHLSRHFSAEHTRVQ